MRTEGISQKLKNKFQAKDLLLFLHDSPLHPQYIPYNSMTQQSKAKEREYSSFFKINT